MSEPDATFHHIFMPRQGPKTLLLLHGTGGDENSLVPYAKDIDSDANVLSVRGRVLEAGMPRFFRRYAEGVFDLENMRSEASALASFVASAAADYGFDPDRVFALGYSNGANIAAAMMLGECRSFAGGILFRAMVPFEPMPQPRLSGLRVLLVEGERDAIVPRENAERLAAILRSAGAEVTLRWLPTGHQLGRADFEEAAAWLSQQNAPN